MVKNNKCCGGSCENHECMENVNETKNNNMEYIHNIIREFRAAINDIKNEIATQTETKKSN